MNELAVANTLVISQKKEWGEIVTGFETVNRYVVFDEHGSMLYDAQEEPGSMLWRFIFKALRPFSIVLSTPHRQLALFVERPFRFYFHRIVVKTPEGKLLGTVERQWSWLVRRFRVADAGGNEFCRLHGPLFRPWTFEIRQHGRRVGKITKKWSGLLKEGFSDADNFAAVLPLEMTPEQKSVLLGAVFLIDFVYFENSS